MRVLASPSSCASNSYIDQLYAELRLLDCEVLPLSRETISQRCDICHVHWPDLCLSGTSLWDSVNHAFRLLMLILWTKLRWRAKVVWTVHNLEPHEKKLPIWWRKLFYKLWFCLVDGAIFLSASSKAAFEQMYGKNFRSAIIPHGHYCNLSSQDEHVITFISSLNIRDGDVVFGHYGQIRDYKNVPYLIQEFSKLKGSHFKLIVAGSVRRQDGELLQEIVNHAASDGRIHFEPKFIPDADLEALYRLTSVALLPYRNILNSGSAIHSLSFGCPVLVPDVPTMLELQEQVSASHVRLLSEQGLVADLEGCVANPLQRCPRQALADLEWSSISSLTKDFFDELRSVS